jgi:hypothetical protein
MNLPVVVPDREPLTEEEALRVGDSVYRLRKLRQMLQASGPFDLTALESVGWGTARTNFRLSKLDAEAVISLLIEREMLFLASFNVNVQQGTPPHV